MQQIRDFIQTERERFEWKHNNMFTVAFAEISRYYDYLQIMDESDAASLASQNQQAIEEIERVEEEADVAKSDYLEQLISTISQG